MHEHSVIISIKSLDDSESGVLLYHFLLASVGAISSFEEQQNLHSSLWDLAPSSGAQTRESTVAAENKLVFLKQMNVGTKQTSSGFWDNIYAVNKRSKFILTSNPWKSKIHESFCNAHLCPLTVNEGELNPSSIVRVEASGAWLLPLMPPVWGKFRNDSQPSCRSYI